jgi:hypothetical protein
MNLHRHRIEKEKRNVIGRVWVLFILVFCVYCTGHHLSWASNEVTPSKPPTKNEYFPPIKWNDHKRRQHIRSLDQEIVLLTKQKQMLQQKQAKPIMLIGIGGFVLFLGVTGLAILPAFFGPVMGKTGITTSKVIGGITMVGGVTIMLIGSLAYSPIEKKKQPITDDLRELTMRRFQLKKQGKRKTKKKKTSAYKRPKKSSFRCTYPL